MKIDAALKKHYIRLVYCLIHIDTFPSNLKHLGKEIIINFNNYTFCCVSIDLFELKNKMSKTVTFK